MATAKQAGPQEEGLGLAGLCGQGRVPSEGAQLCGGRGTARSRAGVGGLSMLEGSGKACAHSHLLSCCCLGVCLSVCLSKDSTVSSRASAEPTLGSFLRAAGAHPSPGRIRGGSGGCRPLPAGRSLQPAPRLAPVLLPSCQPPGPSCGRTPGDGGAQAPAAAPADSKCVSAPHPQPRGAVPAQGARGHRAV